LIASARAAGPGSVAPRSPASAPPLGPGSRVELRELRIVRERDDEFLVGDVSRGEFVAVPPVAVAVIELLRDGYTLGVTAERVQAETGQEVDVADFAATLVDLGFVARADGGRIGEQVGGGPELHAGGRLGAAAARAARRFYSAPMFVVYGLLFAGCVVALTTVGSLRPHVAQLFFLPNPVLSVALLTAAGMPLAMTHELAHWLGARVLDVPARITVSRRYYMMVMQTDLSALWAVPRRYRFGPLLAGIAWDTVRLSALLTARATALAGWWHPGALVSRLIAAFIVTHVLTISWQFFVFLRTDIYAVLATGLGCLNLTRISRLRLARRYRRLTAEEAAELGAASPRDLAAARWYGWIQAAGLILVMLYFVEFFAPFTVSIARWVATGLTANSPATIAFWEVLVFGCAALVPAATPPLTYLRDRRRRRANRPAGSKIITGA
jgi:putative peptide zinc metalloprotease protein